MLSWFGIDFTRWSKPQLVAARFYFDALFPFVALVVFSWFTRPEPREALDRFFAKVHTPVQPTPRGGSRRPRGRLSRTRASSTPTRSSRAGTGRSSSRRRSDYIGFFGTWALVGVVIVLLWAMVTVR